MNLEDFAGFLSSHVIRSFQTTQSSISIYSFMSRHLINLPPAMHQSRQELHVYSYSVGVVPASNSPPYPQPQPPQRRRLSPFRILVRAFIAVCTLVGVLALLIWLIYRPRTIQVAVDAATLSRFNLNSTTSPPLLSFNLTTGLSISNPNKRVVVYYDLLQAEGFYQGERFGRAALPLSFQGTRRTDAVRAVLEGNSPVGFGGSVVGAFGEDNRTGVFPVDLWVDGAVRYKFGELMTTSASALSVMCPLVLRLMVTSGRVECIVINR